jgi:zinc-ribbon domain/Type VI secretion system VasI, EvfG, VC_A0118
MQICPNCAKELEDRDIICAFCGHTQRAARETTPPLVVIVDKPAAELLVVARGAAAKPNNASRNAILASAAIGAIAAVMFIMLSHGSNAPANAAGVAISSVPATSGKVAAPQAARLARPESTSAPKWSRTRQSQWATDGSRTIGFEVEAQRDVAVYMDRVRPVLAVRCISQQTQVFVVLRSAPSIENGGDTHTVRIGLDDEPDVEQQWLDSSNMQALFAPDGKVLAARMATARHLRFAFKPFNAPPASVEFDVDGFEGPLAAMAKTCAPAAKRGPVPLG